jgi:hypothetical protein
MQRSKASVEGRLEWDSDASGAASASGAATRVGQQREWGSKREWGSSASGTPRNVRPLSHVHNHDMLGKHILRQAWHESAFGSQAGRKKQAREVRNESHAQIHTGGSSRGTLRASPHAACRCNVRSRKGAGVGHWGMSNMHAVRHPLHLRTRRAVVREVKGSRLGSASAHSRWEAGRHKPRQQQEGVRGGQGCRHAWGGEGDRA